MTTRGCELKTHGKVRYPTSWESSRREVCDGYRLSRHYWGVSGALSPAFSRPALRLLPGRCLGPGHAGHHPEVHDQHRPDLGVRRTAAGALGTFSGRVAGGSAGGQPDAGEAPDTAVGAERIPLGRRAGSGGYHADPQGARPDAGGADMARSSRRCGRRGVVGWAALGTEWLGLGLGCGRSLLAAPGPIAPRAAQAAGLGGPGPRACNGWTSGPWGSPWGARCRSRWGIGHGAWWRMPPSAWRPS